MAINTTMKVVGAAVALAIAGQVSAEGNRYNIERYYASEVSVSEAYLASKNDEAVLIDVRTLGEYAAGRPAGAYNVPYPRIQGSNLQDPRKLYDEVFEIVGGKLDTPIMTLCRTGQRSVLAGNILANPDKYLPGQGLQAFTNVRNIWEGFVGQPRYAFDGGDIMLDVVNNENAKYQVVRGGPYVLDLNNNGKIDTDSADIFTQVKDKNPDKDGWRNFAALPWEYGDIIDPALAYLNAPSLYTGLNLTPVP